MATYMEQLQREKDVCASHLADTQAVMNDQAQWGVMTTNGQDMFRRLRETFDAFNDIYDTLIAQETMKQLAAGTAPVATRATTSPSKP